MSQEALKYIGHTPPCSAAQTMYFKESKFWLHHENFSTFNYEMQQIIPCSKIYTSIYTSNT